MSRLLCRTLAVLSLVSFGPHQSPACAAQDRAPAVDPAPQAYGDVRPGDVVRLRIWREPDLSGDFQVDETGQVVLPKIGPTDVRGLSREALKRRLLSEYATYLRNPSVDVVLLRRINVLGSVRNPGLYPVDATLTVADALAMAGGATPDGKPDQVELVRGAERLKVRLNRGTRLADTPLRSGDQLYVPQRSWLSRNTGLVVGTLTATAGLIITLTR